MSEVQPRRLPTKLYSLFIEPRQRQQSLRNREIVFNVVLSGTGLFMLALFMLLLYSFAVLGNHFVFGRLAIAIVSLAFVGSLFWLSRHVQYLASAYALVAFYTLLAVGSVAQWGIGEAFGILLLGLLIVLASTLLSSRHALYAAAIASATVVAVQIADQTGLLTPYAAAQQAPTGLGDAIGQTVVFAILGTISWLFGREMERSLTRAESAESQLEQEKANLEARVTKRTAELKQAQIEEMRQLYRFAEVGQLSTALLHDLANYLTVLALEIDSMQSNKYTETLSRCREAISRLNSMLGEVRDRLAKGPNKQHCNLVSIIDDVVAYSVYKNTAPGVQIIWEPPYTKSQSKKSGQDFGLFGDPVKCSQIIAILLGNAIDAYAGIRPASRKLSKIIIQLEKTNSHIHVTVTDWGVGIAPHNRSRVFKPDYTTKKQGMGIGLYLAKQMVVTEFGGSLRLEPVSDRTEFVVSLPKSGANHAG